METSSKEEKENKMSNKDKLEQLKLLIEEYQEIYDIEDIINNEKYKRNSKNYITDKIPQEIYDELKNEYLPLAKGIIVNLKCKVHLHYDNISGVEIEPNYEKIYKDEYWARLDSFFNDYIIPGELGDIIKTQDEKLAGFRNNVNKTADKYVVSTYSLFEKIQEDVREELDKLPKEELTYSIIKE